MFRISSTVSPKTYDSYKGVFGGGGGAEFKLYFSVCHTLTLYNGSQAGMTFERRRSDTDSVNAKSSNKSCHSATLFTRYFTGKGRNCFARSKVCFKYPYTYIYVCVCVCVYTYTNTFILSHKHTYRLYICTHT